MKNAVVGSFCKNINIPTRIIHSSDDPFMFKATVPEEKELNDYVDFLLTEKGGHVGFVSGSFLSKLRYWSEDKIVDFIS